MLSQEVDGVEHPIAFASRTLTDVETRYHNSEREALAVIWALEHFREYITDQKVHVFTDHEALLKMLKAPRPEGRFARWVVRLMGMDVTLHHRKGVNNGNADALSRLPQVDTVTVTLFTRKEIHDAQQADAMCMDIINRLTGTNLQQAEASLHGYFVWQDLLYMRHQDRRTRGGSVPVIVLPDGLRARAIESLHDHPLAGHKSVNATVSRMEERFFWPNMRRDVQAYVDTCPVCAQHNSSRPMNQGTLQPLPIGSPWSRVHMDFTSELPITARGNKVALIFVDSFTKFIVPVALPDATADRTARAILDRVVGTFGMPQSLLSDRGAQFRSEMVQTLTKQLGIRQLFTTVGHPQTDGQAENAVKVVKTMLRKFCERHHDDWDLFLPMLAAAHNSVVHSSTGETPFFANFGRDMPLPIDTPLANVENMRLDSWRRQLVEVIETNKKLIKEHLEHAQQAQKTQYDKEHDDRQVFWAGERVWLWKLGPRNSKWDAHWEGPYRVADRLNDHLYTLIGRDNKTTGPINVTRMKAYRCRENIPPVVEAPKVDEELLPQLAEDVEPVNDSFATAWRDEGSQEGGEMMRAGDNRMDEARRDEDRPGVKKDEVVKDSRDQTRGSTAETEIGGIKIPSVNPKQTAAETRKRPKPSQRTERDEGMAIGEPQAQRRELVTDDDDGDDEIKERIMVDGESRGVRRVMSARRRVGRSLVYVVELEDGVITYIVDRLADKKLPVSLALFWRRMEKEGQPPRAVLLNGRPDDKSPR